MELFDAMWGAVDTHALTILERGSAPITAYVNAHLETLALIAGRLHQSYRKASSEQGSTSDTLTTQELEEIIKTQVELIWGSFLARKLVTKPGEFGSALGKALIRLQSIDPSA